jgi:uncharacterized damage-inducible protein DinB
MTIPEIYDYLVRARRDLRAALADVPDDALSRPLLDGARFHCIKDLVFHVAEVEDGWINGDIRRGEMVQCRVPALKDTAGGAVYAGVPLQVLLDYWMLVEQGTLAWLPTLDDVELARAVAVDDAGERRHTVGGLLWHVMIHEMRHTAQIAALLRTQGIEPPSLDLLWYLPQAQAGP